MTEPTDEQLYAAWTAGDQGAGKRLVDRRLDGILRFVRTVLTGSECEDAVQEVFERLARRANQQGEINNVKAFTAGIARNVVREQLRGRGKQGPNLAECSFADLRPNQSAEMVQREDNRLLLKGLHRMPVDDQILLGLRYWQRLRTRELAEILGSNHNTVRTQLRRAEARLRKLICEIAESPAAAESTMGSFSGWARGVRDRVDGGEP